MPNYYSYSYSLVQNTWIVIAGFIFLEYITVVYVLGHDTNHYYKPVETAQDIVDKGLIPIIPEPFHNIMKKSSTSLYRYLADIAGAVYVIFKSVKRCGNLTFQLRDETFFSF